MPCYCQRERESEERKRRERGERREREEREKRERRERAVVFEYVRNVWHVGVLSG